MKKLIFIEHRQEILIWLLICIMKF